MLLNFNKSILYLCFEKVWSFGLEHVWFFWNRTLVQSHIKRFSLKSWHKLWRTGRRTDKTVLHWHVDLRNVGLWFLVMRLKKKVFIMMYKISKNRSIVKNKEIYVIIDNYFISLLILKKLKVSYEILFKKFTFPNNYFFVACN